MKILKLSRRSYSMKYIIMKCHVTSMLVLGESGRLGTLIPVVSVETSSRNNLTARCGIEYPLELM
jgi:hypothetical protein